MHCTGHPFKGWFWVVQVEKIEVPLLMQFGKEDKHKGFSDPEVRHKTDAEPLVESVHLMSPNDMLV